MHSTCQNLELVKTVKSQCESNYTETICTVTWDGKMQYATINTVFVLLNLKSGIDSIQMLDRMWKYICSFQWTAKAKFISYVNRCWQNNEMPVWPIKILKVVASFAIHWCSLLGIGFVSGICFLFAEESISTLGIATRILP